MRSWLIPWLFPVGLLGALVLLTRGSALLDLMALAWALVVIPGILVAVARRSTEGAARLHDLQTNYWRTGPR